MLSPQKITLEPKTEKEKIDFAILTQRARTQNKTRAELLGELIKNIDELNQAGIKAINE